MIASVSAVRAHAFARLGDWRIITKRSVSPLRTIAGADNRTTARDRYEYPVVVSHHLL